MAMPAHTRTWQFCLNQAVDVSTNTGTNPAVNDRLLMKALVDSMLGRNSWVDKTGAASASAGNWTVTCSCDGSGGGAGVGFGNFGGVGAGVNYWDTAGVIDVNKLIWANPASNHSWIVLQQTGVAAKMEMLIDLRVGGASISANIVVSNAGFCAANGGADGTATAAPTAAAGTFQAIVSATQWGGGALLGSVWHAMKSTDGKAWRFFVMRSAACVAFYQVEIPDPVVNGWTSPWVAHGIGSNAATEQLTTTRMTGANTYSRTPGGTIFASSYCQPGSQSDTNMVTFAGSGFGATPNEIDDTDTIHPIALQSVTVNARGVNGKLVDAYWGNEPGITFFPLAGTTMPAGGPIQWCRLGCLWVPWVAGVIPRVQL
jgi:hypothetical protein